MIPELVRKGKVQAAIFEDYWAYARNVDDYYVTSMDLLDPSADFDPGKWDIQTNAEHSGIGDVPPAWIGRQAEITNSLVSPGVRVFGKVSRSILSPGVEVEEGAEVVDCVLFHGVKVAAGACLNRVVADKHVRFEQGATVGHGKDAPPNRLAPGCQSVGVTVLGREAHVLADVVVGANCQIAPETTVPERTTVPDGENLS